MALEIRMSSSLGFERPRRATTPATGAQQIAVRLEPGQVLRIVPLLTPREISVLRELVKGSGGASNKEIGARLGLSEDTIKIHFNRMLTKTGMNNRVELALWAERSGMFALEVPGYVDFNLAA